MRRPYEALSGRARGAARRHAPAGGRVRGVLASQGPAAARIVVTVAAAWQVALWLGADQPPVYAAVVPLVALGGDPATALRTSLQRVLGVVAGVAVGIAALNVLHPSTDALTLVVALGLGIGMLLRVGGPPNVQVPASSLLVFASTSPDAYALHRLWETAAGAAVTVLLAPLLWPADPRRALTALARDSSAHLTRALAGTAAALGADPAVARDNVAAVTGHVDAVHDNAARAREAERSVRFNPLHRRHRDSAGRTARAVTAVDRLAPHLETLAGEVAAFTARDDLAPVVTDARPHLRALTAATGRAITGLLDTGGPGPALATVRDGLAAYARADSRPAAVALRRPFQQILQLLDGLGRVPQEQEQEQEQGQGQEGA
ncbi:FUSC family protein [Kitasatospora sp. NPDC090308]|uniref:FUSC family protein n=1 Tax=Kitasatospora sp. NPDC090308 TaxID=3364082 RepID=UPI00380A7D71